MWDDPGGYDLKCTRSGPIVQQGDDRSPGHGVQHYDEDTDHRGLAAVATSHNIVLFVFFTVMFDVITRTTHVEVIDGFFIIFQLIRLFNNV